MKLLLLPFLLALIIFIAKISLGLPAQGLIWHFLVDLLILFFLSLGIYKLGNTTWLFPDRTNARLTFLDQLFGLEKWVRTPPGSWRNFSGVQIFGLISLGLTLGYLVLRIYPVILAKEETLAILRKSPPKEIAAAALHQCAMPMGSLQSNENFYFYLHPQVAAELTRGCSVLQKETSKIAKKNKIIFVEWEKFPPAYLKVQTEGDSAVVEFVANKAQGMYNWAEAENDDSLRGELVSTGSHKKIPLNHAAFSVGLQRSPDGLWRLYRLPESIFREN